MPCYQCSHCNKCGIFSRRIEFACKTCGAAVVPGQAICPECSSAYAGNTVRGRMIDEDGTAHLSPVPEAEQRSRPSR